jgi:hypothetical protein
MTTTGSTTSRSLASSQSHSLAIFLQLGDQSVTMLDHISVLLVFVVWPGRLDDASDSVYGARDAVASDEFREVPERMLDGSNLAQWGTDLSRNSTVTPKLAAIVSSPTTR